MSRPPGVSPNALTVIIGIIVIGWFSSVIAGIFVEGYQPPIAIDQLMLAVIGFLFAGRQYAIQMERENRNKNKPDQKDENPGGEPA